MLPVETRKESKGSISTTVFESNTPFIFNRIEQVLDFLNSRIDGSFSPPAFSAPELCLNHHCP